LHAGAPYKIKKKERKNDDRKSTVFSSRRNVVSDGAFLTDDGRLSHARAEATGKARSPSVERLVDGTTSMAESTKRGKQYQVPPLWATISIPKFWRKAKVIAVEKPGKDPSLATELTGVGNRSRINADDNTVI